jgi:hypothetical protein
VRDINYRQTDSKKGNPYHGNVVPPNIYSSLLSPGNPFPNAAVGQRLLKSWPQNSELDTDYRLSGTSLSEAMETAEGFLFDHRRILTRSGAFRAAQAREEHLRSREWLAGELSRDSSTPTVVITHHAPHPASIHARFAGSPVNGAFVSDLTELVAQPDLSLHGHVHDSFDYRVGRCRVVCNPRGYAQNRKQAVSVDETLFENQDFQSQLVIDLRGPGINR